MTIIDNLQYFSTRWPLKIALSKIINDDLAIQFITLKELNDQLSILSYSIKIN